MKYFLKKYLVLVCILACLTSLLNYSIPSISQFLINTGYIIKNWKIIRIISDYTNHTFSNILHFFSDIVSWFKSIFNIPV